MRGRGDHPPSPRVGACMRAAMLLGWGAIASAHVRTLSRALLNMRKGKACYEEEVGQFSLSRCTPPPEVGQAKRLCFFWRITQSTTSGRSIYLFLPSFHRGRVPVRTRAKAPPLGHWGHYLSFFLSAGLELPGSPCQGAPFPRFRWKGHWGLKEMGCFTHYLSLSLSQTFFLLSAVFRGHRLSDSLSLSPIPCPWAPRR